MKLIYLHLYKDTYFMVMQPYKAWQSHLQDSANHEKNQNQFTTLKLYIISKNRVY